MLRREDNLIKPHTVNKLGKATTFRFQPNYNPLPFVLDKVTRVRQSAHLLPAHLSACLPGL